MDMKMEGLTSHGLLARLDELIAAERRTIVDELLCLAEIERRRIHLELSSSLFTFCTDRLKWTKGTAWRRTTAAGMVAKRPVIAEYLRDGRLSTTTLVLLKDVIETDPQVLDRAAGKTEDEVRELVAAMRPRDVVADLFTRVSVATGSKMEPSGVIAGAGSKMEPHATFDPRSQAGSKMELRAAEIAGAALQRATIEPVSMELRRMHVTVSKEFVEDLAKVKALLSHRIPDGNLEKVLHECVKKTIEVCEKRKRGAETGRKRAPTTRKGPRGNGRKRIATAVAREVWKRDQGKCAFVLATGERCGSTHQVEMDHVVPDGKGGPATVANLRLLCRQHNQYEAERAYGREVMEAWRRANRRQ
jgi:5-methylcytosine-specific restriction endonuclease McrA